MKKGLFLGLRLESAVDVQSGAKLQMDGGLIICDDHIAYALTRLPEMQSQVAELDIKSADTTSFDLLQSFEVSIGTQGLSKTYSTRTGETGNAFDLDNFEILDATRLVQHVVLDDRAIDLIFKIDIYQPEYEFQHRTSTTAEAAQWMSAEQNHLLHHAERVL